jgi:glucosamine--fructose-6-phosphate aminotransferase (isomerizing)
MLILDFLVVNSKGLTMCGIVGAIAQRNVTPILIEGLKRLEYRGYDSAGIAIFNTDKNQIERQRCIGKVANLHELLEANPLSGHIGIAHTRWATHGKPTLVNAHPHCSHDTVAVVHNGIIENHSELREKLTQDGYAFETQTDTEVIAHLIHFYTHQETDFLAALKKATQELKGAYALGVMHHAAPDTLYAVRCGSPLVIGIGIGEHFIASDPLALLPVTQQFIYLEEGDFAQITTSEATIFDKDGAPVSRTAHTAEIDMEASSKGNYRHYMLKEIFEQPQAILDTINGHILDSHIDTDTFGAKATDILAKIKRIQIVACGTSYHASMVAKHWLETYAGVPCQIDIASEYRYRTTLVEPDCLFIALSQSGETADTLAALRKAKKLGFSASLSICNVPESSLVRETDLVFLTRSGTEVGVAATKTFTAQLVALLLLTFTLCQIRQPKGVDLHQLNTTLMKLPSFVKQTLALDEKIQAISHNFTEKYHALFLGRGIHYPIALEGALKLKEISYLHAEAYPAGELKHGPLALVDNSMPVIVIASNDALSDKLASNIQEVQARNGELYIFADETLNWGPQPNVHIIPVPHCPEILSPIVNTIPLQLLSYHIAVLKGTDVDQPRNLAKSVTVE